MQQREIIVSFQWSHRTLWDPGQQGVPESPRLSQSEVLMQIEQERKSLDSEAVSYLLLG